MGRMKQEYILQAKYEGDGEVGRFRSDLQTLGKIGSIKALGKEISDLNVRFKDARKKLEAQAKEMGAVDKVTKEMTRSYKASQREVSRLAAALDKKKAAFSSSITAIRKSGVDTKNLAAEERRLATSSEAVGKVWAARSALGVKSHKDIRNEIKRLNTAYNDLKTSGKASALELFQAKHRLREETKRLIDSTNGWGASLEKVQTGAVALAGVGYGLVKVFKEWAAFETGMAEVYTLLDISAGKFKEFKKESKGIMSDLAQENRDLTKSLYDLISAGVEYETANFAIEKSAKAATAGVSDVKTAVNLGMAAVNAYGKEVDNLDEIFDYTFQTVKRGVTTFPELAQSLGDVLPTARSADVEFHEVSAAIAALTKAGIKTPQAATALKGAIRAMAAPAPDAAKVFAELGITWDGLLPTLEAIAEKGLSIDQMRMLIPDVEASTGVLALTQNLDSFRDILSSMDDSGGSMETAYQKMADTPDHEIKMMTKSIYNLMVGIGKLSGVAILPLANGLGWLVDQVNDSNIAVKVLLSTIGGVATGTAIWKLGLGSVVTALGGMILKTHELTAKTGMYTSALGAARAGLAKLLPLIAANPITAGATVAAVLAAGAAWLVFGRDSLEASKKHAETAKAIGETRKAVDSEIESLEKLREVLSESTPDSEEYLDAERKLAQILPTANNSLDEQGRLIAKVGDASSENAQKLDEFIKKLREESDVNLALQVEAQAKAYEEADEALKDYKDNMASWYDIGGNGRVDAPFWRALNKLTGTYDKNIKAGEEVRTNVAKQKKAYEELLQSLGKTGRSTEELSAALDKAHVSAELKQSIIDDYKQFGTAVEEVGVAAVDAAETQENAFAQSAKAVKSEYAKLAQEVKSILDEIANRQLSLTEELREMSRSGMSDHAAWKDLKKEAEEYYLAAEEAAAAGDFDQAVELADKAKSKYKELNTEVKNGEQVVVSAGKAQQTAMEGVKKAGELAIEILKSQSDATKEKADEIKDQAGAFSDGWSVAWDDFLADGKQSIDQLEARLDKLIRDREIKVNITATESRQAGGLIGARMMLGGMVQKLATGGPVGGFYNALDGLRLSGYGGGDRRWILGEDGEVMLRKESVRSAGSRAALAFNSGQWDIVVAELMSRFNLDFGSVIKRRFGGFVNAVSTVTSGPQMLSAGGPVLPSSGVGAAGDGINITLHYSGGGSRTDAVKMTDMVLVEIKRRTRGYGG